MAPHRRPLPEPVRVELDRIGARWAALPLDEALAGSGAVRRVAQAMADDAARLAGHPTAPLPDLGPAVLLDQLRVTAYDLTAAGGQAAPRLEELRREL